jgi:hypothetical protein
MIGFEISLNGNLLCTAGVEPGVTTVILSHVVGTRLQAQRNLSPETELSVSGLHSLTEESMTWLHQEIETGDEITVRVLTTDSASPVHSSKLRDAEAEQVRQREYVEKMAEQLGWKIIKPESHEE